MFRQILVQNADGIVTVTLNVPEQRNAIDLLMREEIAAVVDDARQDPHVLALVIAGQGGYFSAGGDLKSLGPNEDRALRTRDRLRRLQTWFPDLVHLPKPVIAAVDGVAFGAGFSLALAADVILASPRARFSQVFGRIGVVPDLSSLYLLPRRVGSAVARELILTARMIDAAEAKAINLVSAIVPVADLAGQARSMAMRMGERSAHFPAIKSAMNDAFDRPW